MTSTDPIFAAIEAHRAADAAWGAAVADDGLAGAEYQTMDRLLRTVPTTLAGMVAVLRYLGEWGQQPHGTHLFDRWSEPRCSAGAAFLPMLANAIEAMAREGGHE